VQQGGDSQLSADTEEIDYTRGSEEEGKAPGGGQKGLRVLAFPQQV
jgi:hypothetical protein